MINPNNFFIWISDNKPDIKLNIHQVELATLMLSNFPDIQMIFPLRCGKTFLTNLLKEFISDTLDRLEATNHEIKL